MVTELIVAYRTATAALNTLKVAVNLSTDVKVNQAVIELQQCLIEIQTQMFAAQGEMEELTRVKNEIEAKLKSYEDWDKEKNHYELFEWAPGLFVYALKKDANTGEPPHYLCPQCFQQRKKRFLQKQSVTTLNYRCQECGFDVLPSRPSTPNVRRIGDRGGDWYRG